MFWSKSFIPTIKEIPQEAESRAHQLMLRAGLARMLVSGVYSYLPVGLKVLDNIENIIRQEMDRAGSQELLLPCLQPQELWDKSGRNKQMEEVMIRFVDRRGRKMCLGPTHEEVITDLVSKHVSSYKQLPLVLYQIQTKFRDEIRPRFGLIRSCEFIMKDAYSFDSNEEGLDKNYNLMFEAYLRIFKRCGISCVVTEADSGVMGGNVSHEFMVLADSGEDMVFICESCNYAATNTNADQTESCPKCESKVVKKKAIEIGHIFKLGDKYSKAQEAMFVDREGLKRPVIMGCYGIGVSRLIAAIIETNNDENGIIWPKEVSPFDIEIVPLNITNGQSKELALNLYEKLRAGGLEALLDDRDERSGAKFYDADLIGIPLRVIIGERSLKTNEIELQYRADKRIHSIKIEDAAEQIFNAIKKKDARHIH